MPEEDSIDTLTEREIKSKILDVTSLPEYGEVMQFMQSKPYKRIKWVGRKSWLAFCEFSKLYHVPTVEFVDELADEIKKLGQGPAVEVCAGDGKLSYHLKKRNVDIRATDDYSDKNYRRQRSLVMKLSCREALERYNPSIVVASWIPSNFHHIGIDILNFPSVEYFINVQQDKRTLRAEDSAQAFGFSTTRLHDVEKHGICWDDYPGVQPYTKVVLVKKPASPVTPSQHLSL